MLLMGYGILAVLVIAISIRLSYYVDVLDQKSNLSAAFLGGVMLAAVTSLPELFTSIASTVFLQKRPPAGRQAVAWAMKRVTEYQYSLIGVMYRAFSESLLLTMISTSQSSTMLYTP